MIDLESFKKGIDRLASIAIAEKSFYEFFKQAWPTMEGDTPFIDGWHIKAVADHLQAAFERKIKKLLINVPPRSSKTSVCSIAFPAWVWSKNPSEQFIYASYSGALSMEHSVKCRRLIESDFYQSRWGHVFQLSKDQNTKGYFSNDKLGARRATSVGSSVTGSGGSFLIQDDPNAANDGSSESSRKAAIDFWTQVWQSRLNDPKTGVKVVIQQRVHQEDVSGYILENEEDWVKLVIPMEFEESRKSKTIPLEKDVYTVEMEDGSIRTFMSDDFVSIDKNKILVDQLKVNDVIEDCGEN